MSASLGRPVGSGPIVVAGAHIQGLVMRVDQVPAAGQSVLGHGYAEPVDGGKATNQAVCAARLGAPVRFVTVLGNDERGIRWRAFLENEGIDMTWAHTSAKPTDVGFVMIGPEGVPAIATALDANVELDSARAAEAAGAFTGGSMVICQLEASAEFALAAFRAARAGELLTILNPSPAARLPADLMAVTDILVPNEHEAAYLAGEGGSPARLARTLHRQWPGVCVILTAGPAGAYVCDAAGQEHHAAAPAVEVADTTGAGDAFLGALAEQLRVGRGLAGAVQAAVTAASRSVTLDGTIPSYGNQEEVTAWAGQVLEARSAPAGAIRSLITSHNNADEVERS